MVVKPVVSEEEFEAFVAEIEPRLMRALIGAYGAEVGREAARDAIAYAWETRERIASMNNPVGYLYRVGQSRSRAYRRARVLFPDVPASGMPEVDPRLPGALARLSHQQRAAVVLLYVEELSEREAAEAMGISRASVRKHAERGLARLRRAMGVSDAE